jgi:hypothetical protein
VRRVAVHEKMVKDRWCTNQVEERRVSPDGSDAGRQQNHPQTLQTQDGKIEIGRSIIARFAFDFDLKQTNEE